MSSFNINQDLEVLAPKKEKVLPIRLDEWRCLKNKINRIVVKYDFYYKIGGGFIGSGLSVALAVITGQVAPEKLSIAILLAIFATIIGGLSLYYSKTTKEVVSEKIGTIITDMDTIEKRYDTN